MGTYYKNVDICDLGQILQQGLLPISSTGNDNWSSGKRADNSRDVVYLFKADRGVSMTKYGIALVEVRTDAQHNELTSNDCNRGLYEEYICDEVKPEEITAVYIPQIFRCRLQDSDELPHDSRIKYCGMEAETYHADNSRGAATAEELNQFAKTAKLNTRQYLFFRGIAEDRTIIDLYNVKYII